MKVRLVGVGGRLALTLSNTSCIESMISVARTAMGRAEMPILVAAIRREVNRRTAFDGTVTPLSTIRGSPDPDVARRA